MPSDIGTLRGVVVTNRLLTNFALGYTPEGMIGEQVAAIVPVPNSETGTYVKWFKGDAFRRVNTIRADGDRANQTSFRFDKATFLCEEYALEFKVTDRQRKQAESILQPALAQQQFQQYLIDLDQEIRLAGLYTNTANYASGNSVTLSGTDQWNNASFAGNIEKVIDDGKEAVRLGTGGSRVDTIIIPEAVAKVVKRDAKVRELVKYTDPNLLVNGDLPPTLWRLRVVSPAAVYNTEDETFDTDTYDPSDVWGNDVVLTMRPKLAGTNSLAHIAIFRHRGFQTDQWREEAISADWFRVGKIQDEQVISDVAGYVIKAAIA